MRTWRHEPEGGAAGRRVDHPYAADIEAERRGWYEIVDLVRSLTPDECLEPGYQRDPDWTVRDVVAHLGTWLAEAQVQFERMTAGDVRGPRHRYRRAERRAAGGDGRPALGVAWVQANAGRTRMIEEWWRLRDTSDEAAWWIRKSGSEHYAEHLDRLREWRDELIQRRAP